MKAKTFAPLLVLIAVTGPCLAQTQEQPNSVKAWIDSDWAAKAETMRQRGATSERTCDQDEDQPDKSPTCANETTATLDGWTLTMVSGEGIEALAVYCIEKTGGRLRWCKDNATGQTQKFFRSGDDWIVHGK